MTTKTLHVLQELTLVLEVGTRDAIAQTAFGTTELEACPASGDVGR